MHIDHFNDDLCVGVQSVLHQARGLYPLIALLSGVCGFFCIRSEEGIVVDTRPTLVMSGPQAPSRAQNPPRILPVGYRDIFYPGFAPGSSFRESKRPAGYRVTVHEPDSLAILSAFTGVDEWPGWIVRMALWSAESMTIVGYHELFGRGGYVIGRDAFSLSFYR